MHSICVITHIAWVVFCVIRSADSEQHGKNPTQVEYSSGYYSSILWYSRLKCSSGLGVFKSKIPVGVLKICTCVSFAVLTKDRRNLAD